MLIGVIGSGYGNVMVDISVRVEGCKGCELEYYGWNNSCDHCEGYHYEERLRSEYDK